MEFVAEDIVKLVLAIIIGGLIGAEREYRDRSAGFRTLIFICVGATLFTMFSLKIGINNDPARIAAQIVSGVGFLGAGAILRDGSRIIGLTTAAMIWLVAALGVGIGSGNYLFASIGAVVIMVVLWVFPLFEQWIDSVRCTENYEIICALTPGRYEELLTDAHEAKLQIVSSKCTKVNENMIITLVLRGSPRNQAAMAAHLLSNPNIKEFRY